VIRTRLGLLVALLVNLVIAVAPGPRAGAAPPPVHRIAVVVGANAPPPGRAALRYAHEDARRMAEVLERVGRFRPGDVHLLLEPSPGDITGLLERLGREVRTDLGDTVLVFYYSGHSDGQVVFPGGRALGLADLRTRIEAIGARLRLGILDTCRGGGWTQTKGLSVGPPLEPIDLMNVTSEGTALLSSSSGLENAHEAEAMQGSFFTHHLIGGLVGAADRNGDGNITLQETFEYAKERTVRDSARMAATTQHPSFDVQLRGRQDVVLAQIAQSPSTFVVTQDRGPLEVIHLGSGVTVVEMPAGARKISLALAPGKYLVRRHVDGQTSAKEIEILPGKSTALLEGQLEATANERLAVKGDDERAIPISAAATLPRHWWEIRLAMGAATGPGRTFGSSIYDTGSTRAANAPLARELSGLALFAFGITERLTWMLPLPVFAYRFGDPEGLEVIPRAGLTSGGYSSTAGWLGSLDLGIAIRRATFRGQNLILSASADSDFATRSAINYQPSGAPAIWRLDAGPAYTVRLRDTVTIGLGAHFTGPLRLGAADPNRPMSSLLVFGSVQGIAYREIPLISVHLSPRFSLDGYASWAVDLESGAVHDRYLAGFTWNL
jgi:hypothetical protein